MGLLRLDVEILSLRNGGYHEIAQRNNQSEVSPTINTKNERHVFEIPDRPDLLRVIEVSPRQFKCRANSAGSTRQ